MENPAWKLEYPSLESPAFTADLALAQEKLLEFERLLAQPPESLATEGLQRALLLKEEAEILFYNADTYCACLLAENAANREARSISSQLEALLSRLGQASAPLLLFLQRCPENIFAQVLEHPKLAGHAFYLRQERALEPFLLSPAEEVLLQAVAVSGHRAWANLADDIAGNGKCTLLFPDRTEVVGIAHAQGLTYGADPLARKVAWQAVQIFSTEHRESRAAIVNALAGWRIETARKRSTKKKQTYLDPALFNNRVTAATVNAIVEACRRNLPRLRRAPMLMARTMGKTRLDPWDLLAPSPIHGGAAVRPFAQGFALVKESFAKINPEMAEFAQLMLGREWIEARVLPQKSGGAFCTGFPKTLEPRVFQTYLGSTGDITTLAHELGHAFHSWVMRDLPRAEQNYPSTLAETASVFAETALRDHTLALARSREEKLEWAWSDIESTAGYLINIPARFDFETKFHDLREKSFVGADALEELNTRVWKDWYGDTLGQYDSLFWAHKMHFSMAGSGFYNFPYAFGFLFSLSIYARREALGKEFFPTYKKLLRDTGRMTAEELVQKHLGEDIERPEFWQTAIDDVIAKLDRFEAILGSG